MTMVRAVLMIDFSCISLITVSSVLLYKNIKTEKSSQCCRSSAKSEIKALPIEAGASVFCHSRGVWPCSEFVAIVLRLSPNKALMSVSKRPVSLVKELNLCLFAAAV